MEFSHYNDGKPVMVDVSSKNETERFAKAQAIVYASNETIYKIKNNLLPKGNPFDVARIAGILAAKKTYELIPMCHPLFLTYIDIDIKISGDNSIKIISRVKCKGSTGVEMEALMAASISALTIYDMCKAVDKSMIIGDISLLEKRGGKSDYKNIKKN